MKADLLRNTLKLATAAFLTAAIAVWFQRIIFVWYPLLAVILVVDDNDDHTVQAASSRILGTILGGLITFLVHTALSGWVGVLVSLVVMVPVLRWLGWQSALSTASLIAVMFLTIPTYSELNWDYVFNRGLDTIVGCVVGILVGLLFWPRGTYQELQQADADLRQRLRTQLQAYDDWLAGRRPRPLPLDPAPLSSGLQRLEQLVARERGGPRQQRLRRSLWEPRLRLWQLTHFHWIAWERLLAGLQDEPCREAELLGRSLRALHNQLCGQPGPTPRRDPRPWQQLASRQRLPLLPLLALAEELRPLHACLGGLNRMAPR